MSRLRSFAPFAAIAAVWLAFLAYSWPGLMTWDSINQLLQARSGAYGDWHPPLMAWLWARLDGIVAGPALMLVLQNALLVVGLFLNVRRYTRTPRGAAWITAALLAFPPLFAPFSVVWKDCLLEGLLLCGIAGVLARHRAAQIAGWVAFALAAGLRHNAPILIVPLAMMIVPYATAWPTWRRRALGIGIGLAVSIAGIALDRSLVVRPEYPFANMIALGDVSGAIARESPMSDDEVRDLLAGVPLVQSSNLQERIATLVGDDGSFEAVAFGDQRVFDVATTADAAAKYVEAWRRLLREHTGAYLAYRFELFRQFIGLADYRVAAIVTPLDANAELLAQVDVAITPSRYQEVVAHALKKIGRSFLFWPFLYVILGLGLLVILWRDPLMRGLLIGAFANIGALFVISPGGAEFRYIHWLVVCCVLGTVVRMIGVAETRLGGPKGPPNTVFRS